MKFDKEQERAIKHLNGPLLVIAGPGSGKTTTMIERLSNMILNYNIAPDKILVITFSRAAAEEMKKRFLTRMSPDIYKVSFGTFHSIFLSMLKSFFKDKFDFTLVSEANKRKYIRQAFKAIGYSYISREFLDEFMLDLSLYKNSDSNLSLYKPISCDIAMFTSVLRVYERLMQENQNIDFEDIIIITNNLMSHNKDFRTYWQNKYDYILIDEFQDINECKCQ